MALRHSIDIPTSIIERYNRGVSIVKLSAEIGIGPVTLRKKLAKVTRIRTAGECATATHTKNIEVLDQLIARYKAGETLCNLCREAEVKHETLRCRFIARELKIRNAIEAKTITWLDMGSIAKRYIAGESINTLSGEHFVDRKTIASVLLLWESNQGNQRGCQRPIGKH